jgi:phage-related protein
MILETIDGVRYDLSDFGLKLLTFEIDSLSTRVESEFLDGRDGHIDIETLHEGRSLRASFLMRAENHLDYIPLRNEIFRLFNSRNHYYLINPNEPKRRWKVKSSSKFSLEKISLKTGKLDLSFQSQSPYAESVSSTLNPNDYFQVDTKNPIQYSFDEASFSVWNDGDVDVDPREVPLKIIFKGESNGLIIRNITTGDEWKYNGTTLATDSLVLDGIKSSKNGLSIFGATNRKLLTLNPMWNDFEVLGTNGPIEISFDFRFYYI